MASAPAAAVAVAAPKAKLEFVLNGKKVALQNVDPRQTLLEYVRDTAKLTGTKRSCLQGGCGACLVTLTTHDPVTGQTVARSVNSCLKPLASVDGAAVTTIEHIGSERRGLSAIQERMVSTQSSQCGYCTPGFVMNMYSLLQNGTPTRQQVMDNLDGNVCRCTGYRGICTANESFASDATSACKDIKNADGSSSYTAHPKPAVARSTEAKAFSSGDFTWHQPTTLAQCQQLKQDKPRAAYVLGDTAKGIRSGAYETYDGKAQDVIYLGNVAELQVESESGGCLVFGAARTLQQCIDKLRGKGGANVHVAEALTAIAQHHIRGEGGWAGNLWISRTGFPSDLFPALLAAGAKVSFVAGGQESTVDIENVMPGKPGSPPANALLTRLHIPLQTGVYRYYRTAQRKWLAPAFVNAGFSVQVSGGQVKEARVALGVYGMGPQRVTAAEQALVGNRLDTATLQQVCATFEKLDFLAASQYATVDHPEGKDAYRKGMPAAFAFKFFQEAQHELGLGSWKAAELGSMGVGPQPPLQRGKLKFEEAPGREAVPQIQAKGLATGEVKYTDDHAIDSLYGYLVLAECATGKLTRIDASKAEDMDGVVKVITAKDLPEGSSNSCDFVPGCLTVFVPEGGDIIYPGQQLALVVANTYRQAKKAAAQVVVEIADRNKDALTTLEQAIAADSKLPELLGCPTTTQEQGNPSAQFAKCARTLEGETRVIGQHGAPLERLNALCVPTEEKGMLVYTGTQAADLCRVVVAGVLNAPHGALVEVTQNRTGGGFGIKNSRNIPVASAAAVAAASLERPVRVQLDSAQEFATSGGRHPLKAKYKVGFTNDGKIQAVEIESWLQSGCTHDFTGMLVIEYTEALASVYDWGGHFKVQSHTMKTNTASHTAVRSFGNPQAMFVTEHILERIATVTGLSFEQVRETNMQKGTQAKLPWGEPLEHYNADVLWAKLKKDCQFDARLRSVEQFNAEHRWRKRGIAMVPLSYGHTYVYPSGTGALVNVQGGWLGSGNAGAVTVFHGGCEIGQGIHTKVAQVVALTLGAPLAKVRVGPTNTAISPNQRFTGGSTTSEAACEAARRACLELNKRLEPHRQAFRKANEGKDPTWEELCGAANQWPGRDENLSATGIFSPKGNKFALNVDGSSAGKWHGDYFTFGAGCSEVELDVLTGERRVLRSDVLFDVGQSISPGIDLGQVEGAFCWALGYYGCEEPLWDASGINRDQGVWEYKPPMATEMPIEFHAELLRDNPFKKGVMGSKAVGEPPFMLGYSAVSALKKAIASARRDAGVHADFMLPMPVSVDAVKMACAQDPSQFKC